MRALINNDSYLRSFVVTSAAKCHSYALQLREAVEILEISRGCLSSASAPRVPRFELLPRILSGGLRVESPMIRELLLTLKKLNSTSLLRLISALSSTAIASRLTPIKSEVEALVSQTSGAKLTSEFDFSSSSLRSTAVSKMIEIEVHKSRLTKSDSLYSQLVQSAHDVFLQYYTATLNQRVEHVFLHEVFFYDLVSPHRDVFAPRARATVERALTRPVDYLGCACCEYTQDEKEAAGEDEGTMKSSHPPTSIVYQLYLEGGALINGFDLWSAFKSVSTGEGAGDDDDDGGDDDDDDDDDDGNEKKKLDEATVQALFYRSIAEMKLMGFVKQTRKRVDHLQKLAWKGL